MPTKPGDELVDRVTRELAEGEEANWRITSEAFRADLDVHLRSRPLPRDESGIRSAADEVEQSKVIQENEPASLAEQIAAMRGDDLEEAVTVAKGFLRRYPYPMTPQAKAEAQAAMSAARRSGIDLWYDRLQLIAEGHAVIDGELFPRVRDALGHPDAERRRRARVLLKGLLRAQEGRKRGRRALGERPAVCAFFYEVEAIASAVQHDLRARKGTPEARVTRARRVYALDSLARRARVTPETLLGLFCVREDGSVFPRRKLWPPRQVAVYLTCSRFRRSPEQILRLLRGS